MSSRSPFPNPTLLLLTRISYHVRLLAFRTFVRVFFALRSLFKSAAPGTTPTHTKIMSLCPHLKHRVFYSPTYTRTTAPLPVHPRRRLRLWRPVPRRHRQRKRLLRLERPRHLSRLPQSAHSPLSRTNTACRCHHPIHLRRRLSPLRPPPRRHRRLLPRRSARAQCLPGSPAPRQNLRRHALLPRDRLHDRRGGKEGHAAVQVRRRGRQPREDRTANSLRLRPRWTGLASTGSESKIRGARGAA